MHEYWRVLTQRYALSLLASNLLGRLPNGMGSLAVVPYLRGHGVPYDRVGSVVALFGICSALGGPFLARLVDRCGQPVTLMVGALGSGAGFVLLALVGARSLSAALASVAFAGFFMPPLEPALRSMWPSVLPDASAVESAYALDSTLQNVLYVAGPLLVVVLVTTVSAAWTMVAVGASGVVGSVLFVAVPPVRRWRGRPGVRDWAGALRSRLLLVLLASMLFLGGVFGVFSVSTVAYAEHIGRSGFSAILLGAYSVGSLVGGLAYGARRWHGDPVRRLAVLLALMAAATWLPAVVGGPRLMTGSMALAGMGLAPVLTCGFVLIDGIAPEGTITEAFAWVTAVFLAGSAMGSAVDGMLLSHLGLRAAFGAAAVSGTVACLVIVLAAVSLTIRVDTRRT